MAEMQPSNYAYPKNVLNTSLINKTFTWKALRLFNLPLDKKLTVFSTQIPRVVGSQQIRA
jgi:hypothetical protein